MSLSRFRLALALCAAGVCFLTVVALGIWRDDILEAFLNPKIPYAVYHPPVAPNYEDPKAWARLPGTALPGAPPADVFFIHPTTFDGGREWNGPISDRAADHRLSVDMIPNYAAPFAAVGRVFIPRYRQASLYTSLSLFDDALEARAFAYGDIAKAFGSFLDRIGPNRPFIIVGVEQGAFLADRLLRDRVAKDAGLRSRLVAAYLIDAVVLAADHAAGSVLPACETPTQSGCLVAWVSARPLDLTRIAQIRRRSVVWGPGDRLVGLAGRAPLCVNPLLGAQSEAEAPARLNRGAANASGLEWGAKPGFMARQVSARCQGGILEVSRPRSAELRPSGNWARRRREAPFNLFWADLQADSLIRMRAWGQDQQGSLSRLRQSGYPLASRTTP
jgi:hypothetical protein